MKLEHGLPNIKSTEEEKARVLQEFIEAVEGNNDVKVVLYFLLYNKMPNDKKVSNINIKEVLYEILHNSNYNDFYALRNKLVDTLEFIHKYKFSYLFLSNKKYKSKIKEEREKYKKAVDLIIKKLAPYYESSDKK